MNQAKTTNAVDTRPNRIHSRRIVIDLIIRLHGTALKRSVHENSDEESASWILNIPYLAPRCSFDLDLEHKHIPRCSSPNSLPSNTMAHHARWSHFNCLMSVLHACPLSVLAQPIIAHFIHYVVVIEWIMIRKKGKFSIGKEITAQQTTSLCS